MTTERTLTFGPRGELVGLLTEPDAPAGPPLPAVLLWNVGVNHRVGPFRFNVDLARRLARRGHAVLRFDLSGLGDSAARREALPDAERAVRDVQDALSVLRLRGVAREFVLVGFCSGVDAAHAAAVRESDVVGVVQIEGYAFRTEGFERRRRARLLSPERWLRFAATQLPVVGPRLRAALHQEAVFQRCYPDWGRYTEELEALAARGTRLLLLYLGGDTDVNDVGQFDEMFPMKSGRRAVEVGYFPGTDHTLYAPGSRELVFARLESWLALLPADRSAAARARAGNGQAAP